MPLPLLLAACLACSGEPPQDTIRAARPDAVTRAEPRPWRDAADPALRAADSALTLGRPFAATRLVAPALADPARRTPAAVLLAATAAEGWGGWTEAERLLAGEQWLDTLYGGLGRARLARAVLARRGGRAADSLAAGHARLAIARATNDATRGERTVLLARALDRLDRRPESARAYADAAALLPDAAAWLRLRAAGVTTDAGARARLYEGARGAARARVAWTEGRARERAGDLAGASRSLREAGATVEALGLDARAARGDPAARERVRTQLAAVLERQAGTPAARLAGELLDLHFAPLSPAEQLLVARTARAAGPTSRANAAYAAAFAAGLGTDRDRLHHAGVLARLDRTDDALAAYGRVGGAEAGTAAYERARLLLRAGREPEARRLLADVVARFASDTAAAAPARFILADAATDAGDDSTARRLFAELARQYPTSRFAPSAALRAGVIAAAGAAPGELPGAARLLDEAAARWPAHEEAPALRYWAGRLWAQAGDSTAAKARWREVLAGEPLGYYHMLASRRMGQPVWVPPAGAAPAIPGEVRAAAERARLLDRLDMDVEAEHERDWLAAHDSSAAGLLAAAQVLGDLGYPSRGVALALRALDRGAPRTAALYRLLYPAAHGDVLRAAAAEVRLDPALVAALVRQESRYDPRATSAAGARGLAQVMPAVGARLAQSRRYPVWDPVLLYQPDVSLELGTVHLAGVLRQYPHPAYALAAYNAGASRVTRWRRKAGTADPETFAERIPFDETRDYVRVVLRTRELYAGLHGW